ncbi:MAG: hypothetical protein ACXWT0_14060, partial [Methylobacter sp.]
NEIMLEAVSIGNMVKQASGKNMLELAHRILDKQPADKAASACCGSSSAEKTADTGGCCR